MQTFNGTTNWRQRRLGSFVKSYYADHVSNKWQTLIPQYRSIETGQTVLLVHFLFTSRFNLFFSNRRG